MGRGIEDSSLSVSRIPVLSLFSSVLSSADAEAGALCVNSVCLEMAVCSRGPGSTAVESGLT